MKKKNLIKAMLSFALTLSVVSSMVVSALAADVDASGVGNVPVELSQDATTFRVSIPTTLPVSVSAEHQISTASDVELKNNGYGPIRVMAVDVSEQNGWDLVDFSTDFRTVKVDAKQFGLELQGTAVDPSGSADSSVFQSIDGRKSLAITYDAVVAAQSAAVNETMANVVFTIGWDFPEGFVQLVAARTAGEGGIGWFPEGVTALGGNMTFQYYLTFAGGTPADDSTFTVTARDTIGNELGTVTVPLESNESEYYISINTSDIGVVPVGVDQLFELTVIPNGDISGQAIARILTYAQQLSGVIRDLNEISTYGVVFNVGQQVKVCQFPMDQHGQTIVTGGYITDADTIILRIDSDGDGVFETDVLTFNGTSSTDSIPSGYEGKQAALTLIRDGIEYTYTGIPYFIM